MKHLIEFKEKVKGKIKEDGIYFSDGTTVRSWHDQSCCELVYADWLQLKDTGFEEEEFKFIKITGNPLFGIAINKGYGVPCFDIQNGYYSDNLVLEITQDGKTTTVDISDFLQHER